MDRGATKEQLAKVAGENMLRVWQGVKNVRDQMKTEGIKPVEDVWEGRTWWRYDSMSGTHMRQRALLIVGQYCQMPDPDPEDKLGLDWYGVAPPEQGLYHKELDQRGMLHSASKG